MGAKQPTASDSSLQGLGDRKSLQIFACSETVPTICTCSGTRKRNACRFEPRFTPGGCKSHVKADSGALLRETCELRLPKGKRAKRKQQKTDAHTHKKKTLLPQRVEVVPSVWLSFVAGWCHGSSRRCRVLLFRFPHALSATSAATSIGSEKTHFN